MSEKITAAEAAKMAAKLPKEKLESVLRYMRILVRMKGTHSPEAEALNNSLQAQVEAGELTLPEAGEIMDQLEAALDRGCGGIRPGPVE